jgi:hypothetical protein
MDISSFIPILTGSRTADSVVTDCFFNSKKTQKLGSAILDGYVARL